MLPANRHSMAQDLSHADTNENSSEMSPQLINLITDRVYTLLINDLRIEFERTRFVSQPDDHRNRGS